MPQQEIQIRHLGRAKGHSSIAAAARLTGTDIFDTTAKTKHFGSRTPGVLIARMLAPPGAPASAFDPQVFWEINEHRERRANARLGREITVPLPEAISPSARYDLTTQIGEMLVERYAAVVLAAIHRAPRRDEARFLISAREVGPEGLGARAGQAFDSGSGSCAKEAARLTELICKIMERFSSSTGGSSAAQPAVALPLLPALPLRPHAPCRPLTQLDAAQIEMQLAIERADARGVLMSTPPGHSHAAAFADRIHARRANPPPPTFLVRESGPPASWMARHLGRLARKARSGQDSWARLLGSEAELLSRWHTSILATARDARSAAMISPCTQFEVEFERALTALEMERTAVYGTRPFFFLDIEALASAVTDYAAAVRAPHDNLDRVYRARAQLAQALCPAERASSAVIRAAREAFDSARAQTTEAAKLRGGARLRDARREMREAREHIERSYHITQPAVPEFDPFAAFDATTDSSTARSSDSHQRQLRPKSNHRPGH